jgi:HSP20 family protein
MVVGSTPTRGAKGKAYMITVKIKPRSTSTFDYQIEPDSYLLAGSVGWRINLKSHLWRPPTDVSESKEKVIVRVEIAGMVNSEFSINFDNNILSIQGNRPEIPHKHSYHQMEIHFGEFFTDVLISHQIDIEKIEAIYDDGFLWVILPKALSHNIPIVTRE